MLRSNGISDMAILTCIVQVLSDHPEFRAVVGGIINEEDSTGENATLH